MEAVENLEKFSNLCKELKTKMRLIDSHKKKGNTAEADWLKVRSRVELNIITV